MGWLDIENTQVRPQVFLQDFERGLLFRTAALLPA